MFQGFVHAQAVPLGSASAASAGDGAHCPSAYEWSEQLSDGTLLAVGGGAPSTVHLWNLQQEICMEQVWLQKAVLVTLSSDQWVRENSSALSRLSLEGSSGVAGRVYIIPNWTCTQSSDRLVFALQPAEQASYHFRSCEQCL